MRMLSARHQPEEVYDIDEAQLQVRKMLPQHGCGGKRLHRRDVAATRDDEIGLAVLIAARPFPYPGTLRAVLNRGVHVEILKVRLLVGDNHIDVVSASQAVRSNR